VFPFILLFVKNILNIVSKNSFICKIEVLNGKSSNNKNTIFKLHKYIYIYIKYQNNQLIIKMIQCNFIYSLSVIVKMVGDAFNLLSDIFK
jgi:hypothetical protein